MKVASVQLLGRFAVTVDGASISGDAWRSRRAADVVKLLALTPDHRMHRGQVIDALWPESDSQAGGTNLRKALHFARLALGDNDAIVTQGEVLVLGPGATVDTDVEGFESAARSALAAHDAAACRAASHLWVGELLPDDRYESWLAEPRARLHRRYVDLLQEGGLWEQLAEEDPTHEQAARALMRAHLDSGERREAIRRFERLREALHEQLGVGPDRSTIALYEDVLAAEGAPKPSEAERAHALLAWALVHMNRNEIAEAERAAEEARTIALDGGLGRELGEAAVILAKVAMAQGRWRERFAEELVESMRLRANMEPIVYDAHLCLAEYYLAGPEGYDIAADFARQMMQIADEVGSPTGAALATLMLGEAELLAGNLPEAEDHLKAAAEANDLQGCISGSALARQRLAEAAVIHGRKFDANRLLDRARSLAHRSDLAPHLLVRIFGTKIQAADAHTTMTVLRTAEQELSQMRSCEPCSMGYLTSAATASSRAGQLVQARRFLAEAERIAGMWQGGLWTGAVWEARGALRQAEGETEQARAMFREAAAAFARAGNQADAARCQDAAGALLDGGRGSEGRARAAPEASADGAPLSG
ncbi:transcriptional activator domain-containing protein [Nocardioides islandensis]|uniref:Transcriptional activator domain-containing protein n=1 Tax=Nocardioides islandensis TaxID=433663 RepID=A0A930V8A5_9ACTN|nr:BTAD domain-containing putative transcriptional regulator [Nocardioides islandensis]MBF4762739.1 transcriptional activator domain-containing protein [Nocardioides islandensis]